MKITVTGGSGFLGSHVADALSAKGHKVTIFDKKFSKWVRKDQKMYVGNILKKQDLEAAIKGANAVFHFAGLADLESSLKQPINSVKQNILGTALILNTCQRYKIKRFIHASTIYVNSIEGGFYRSSKRAAEDYVEEYNKIYGLNYTILRFGSLYGPRFDQNNGVGLILKDAIYNKEIQYTGSKKTTRRYVHVLDAAKACIDSLKEKYKNKYLTITGKKEIKITTFLKNLSKMLKITKRVKFKNKKNIGHYETTPFTYKLKKGRVYKINKAIDIYDGVSKLIDEIKNKKTK